MYLDWPPSLSWTHQHLLAQIRGGGLQVPPYGRHGQRVDDVPGKADLLRHLEAADPVAHCLQINFQGETMCLGCVGSDFDDFSPRFITSCPDRSMVNTKKDLKIPALLAQEGDEEELRQVRCSC